MMDQVVALATSLGTLAMMWLAGRKKAAAWVVGLLNQGLWVTFIILFQAWGLIPLTAALTLIYARNLWLWRERGV